MEISLRDIKRSLYHDRISVRRLFLLVFIILQFVWLIRELLDLTGRSSSRIATNLALSKNLTTPEDRTTSSPYSSPQRDDKHYFGESSTSLERELNFDKDSTRSRESKISSRGDGWPKTLSINYTARNTVDKFQVFGLEPDLVHPNKSQTYFWKRSTLETNSSQRENTKDGNQTDMHLSQKSKESSPATGTTAFFLLDEAPASSHLSSSKTEEADTTLKNKGNSIQLNQTQEAMDSSAKNLTGNFVLPDLPAKQALGNPNSEFELGEKGALGNLSSSTTPSEWSNSSAKVSVDKISASGQYPPEDSKCKPLPFEEKTWKTLNLDEYLQNIENGNKTSLEEYALKLNYTNFICGIGAPCWAGQPCYPLPLKDFYILYAAQQWNTYSNVYSDAVGYGIGLVQSSINSLIASLFPASDTTMIKNMKANLGVQAAFAQVTGAVLLDLFSALTAAVGPIGAAFNVLGEAIVVALASGSMIIKEPPGPLKDGFNEWSSTAYALTQYQQTLHKAINEETKKRISSGISTEQGIYGVLKGGTFLNPGKLIELPDYEERVRNLTMAMGTNIVLNRAGCWRKGENGAFPEPERLSYCDKLGGTNANVIYENFGYSAELITQSSVKCFDLGKGHQYSPWQDGKTLPKDATDVCVFNLPVCHLGDKKVDKMLHKKKHRYTVAKACRKAGLPLKKV